jgi:hypothetical protein
MTAGLPQPILLIERIVACSIVPPRADANNDGSINAVDITGLKDCSSPGLMKSRIKRKAGRPQQVGEGPPLFFSSLLSNAHLLHLLLRSGFFLLDSPIFETKI